MNSVIGAFEAKTHFSELLERVERGERITITKHGREVAELVPTGSVDFAAARAAVEGIRALSKKLPETDLSWKELRDEGRKH